MKRKLILISLLFLNLGLNAQTNFSGKWKIKEMKHVTGPKYSNALPEELIIKQTADSLFNGKWPVAMNDIPSVRMDDQSRKKMVRTLKWSRDKEDLIITTAVYTREDENVLELTRIETWHLERDQLVINRKSVETKSESWEAIGVYIKE